MKAASFAAILGTKGRLTIPKENRKSLSHLLRFPMTSFDGAIIVLEIKVISVNGVHYDLESKALINE